MYRPVTTNSRFDSGAQPLGFSSAAAGTSDPSPTPLRGGGPERPTRAALEADLAYCKARLDFIGTPTTANQQAQIQTFRLLSQALTHTLAALNPADMA